MSNDNEESKKNCKDWRVRLPFLIINIKTLLKIGLPLFFLGLIILMLFVNITFAFQSITFLLKIVTVITLLIIDIFNFPFYSIGHSFRGIYPHNCKIKHTKKEKILNFFFFTIFIILIIYHKL